MDAVRTSETLVYSNGATRRYIPEGSKIYSDVANLDQSGSTWRRYTSAERQ
jgi:hypothetical protein